MKNITNYRDQELQTEQFHVLVDVVEKVKTKDDLEYMFEHFLTKSERTYLSQRLNVMRMLAKDFSYSNIHDKLGVPTATIANANKMLENGGDKLRKLLLSYKFIPHIQNSGKAGREMISPHYPGAIKI